MKIFLDTNVLISAFMTRGLCAEILEVILADHQLMTGEFVLDEFQRVLITNLNVDQSLVNETVQFLRNFHVEPMPQKSSTYKMRDSSDLWVLESAIKAKADVVLTGDNDLLAVTKNISQIKFISPRRFWNLSLS